jgi:hypothetical protein
MRSAVSEQRRPVTALLSLASSLRLDLCLVLLFTLAAYGFFRSLDPLDMLQSDAQPWDSSFYRNLSDQILSGGLLGLSGSRPFSYRLLQPVLVTIGRWWLGWSFAEASHAINTVSAILVNLFAYGLWRRLGLERWLAGLGVLLITTSFLGPLRYSIYYPGGQFAFEVLMTAAAFVAIRMLHTSRRTALLLLAALLLFAATLARENIFYLTIITGLVLLGFELLADGSTGVRPGLAASSLRPTLLSVVASLLGLLTVRQLVSAGGDYNLVKTVLQFGWFHLNIGETLYLFFYAFGPLLLAFGLCMSLSAAREAFFLRAGFRTNADSRLMLAFCIASFVFAFVGGTDSDRFLLWAFPFYFYFGLLAFSLLLVSLPRPALRRRFVVAMLIVAVLWTRAYVPAIPHLLFLEKYNSPDGVRTNLNPSLYRGTGLLLPLRRELVVVSRSEAYPGKWIRKPELLPTPYVAKAVTESRLDNSYLGSYRLAANNLPFPLGFAHNQYELLAIHPYHGDDRLRQFLLAQWLGLYAFFLLLIRGQSRGPARIDERLR